MQFQKTGKPATARHGAPAPKTEQLGGELTSTHTPDKIHLQVASLTRRCAISADLAVALAPLAFQGGRE
jgi:hypothetical protein